MSVSTPDRLNLKVWLLLAVLGAILAVVGWYRVIM
jgi:hypothetical protein